MNVSKVGDGKVVLLSGGGKIFTDIAARFVGSEKSLEEIVASPYDKNIVKNILNSNHGAATEFDYFVFGVEGYSRVCETQLVRKRIASYLIKSGRKDKAGRRSFDMVVPESIKKVVAETSFSPDFFYVLKYDENGFPKKLYLDDLLGDKTLVYFDYDYENLLAWIAEWYEYGVLNDVPEEDLRYIKPQATEFKAIIGMNCHSLLDWFKIRCCLNAQTEIRDLANKMLKLCKEVAPDLFENAGANCKSLGYCPENKLQNAKCKGKILTKDEAMEILKNHKSLPVKISCDNCHYSTILYGDSCNICGTPMLLNWRKRL